MFTDTSMFTHLQLAIVIDFLQIQIEINYIIEYLC